MNSIARMKMVKMKFAVAAIALPLSLSFAATLAIAQANTANGASNASNGPAGSSHLVVPFTHPGQPGRVELQMLGGNITVKPAPGNDVIINGLAEPMHGPATSDETRGMHRLTQPGNFGTDVDNNTITIHPGFREQNIDLQVPAGAGLSLKSVHGSIQVQGITGDLELETVDGSIWLDQVGGSVVAHALNGSVTANLARADANKPFSFSTMNGRIELTLPAAMRANLNMRSDNGDVFIDDGFDFRQLPSSGDSSEPATRGMHHLRTDNSIRGALNGGGVEVNVRSFNGAILVHKGK
jgi:hypothetical protein